MENPSLRCFPRSSGSPRVGNVVVRMSGSSSRENKCRVVGLMQIMRSIRMMERQRYSAVWRGRGSALWFGLRGLVPVFDRVTLRPSSYVVGLLPECTVHSKALERLKLEFKKEEDENGDNSIRDIHEGKVKEEAIEAYACSLLSYLFPGFFSLIVPLGILEEGHTFTNILSLSFQGALGSFRKATGQKPLKIIFYRFSLNETMFQMVISQRWHAYDGLKETNDHQFLSADGSLLKNMVKPDDICSQVGLCSAKRIQSKEWLQICSMHGNRWNLEEEKPEMWLDFHWDE
ncbi:hypothetical protein V8G54_010344, partial [Vigna mungo]